MISIADRVIPVMVGRGKTGEAKTGKPRYLLLEDGDGYEYGKLWKFLYPYWKRTPGLDPWDKWFRKTLTHFLGDCDPDVDETVSWQRTGLREGTGKDRAGRSRGRVGYELVRKGTGRALLLGLIHWERKRSWQQQQAIGLS